jgi:hypothetical protein
MEAQAAFCGGDDPEDFLGKHLIVGRSVGEDYRKITLDPRHAAVWSMADLAGPCESPTQKEEDDWSFDFSDGDGGGNGDGDDTDNLDYNTF